MLKLAAWGGWVLQIFYGLFSITMQKKWRKHKLFKQKKSMESFRMQNLDVINCIEKTNSSNEENE